MSASRATSSVMRMISPVVRSPKNFQFCAAASMSSESKSQGKSPKKEAKQSKSTPKSQPAPPTPAQVDKGDTYRAGESFYSYNPYSFYDIENSMESKRLPQPSGEKMIEFCYDKLNPDARERRLLPIDYGHLKEYPGKTKRYGPLKIVVSCDNSVPERDPETDPYHKQRMPM